LTGFLKMALVISREHRDLRLEPARGQGGVNAGSDRGL
jgi:hypothetical protein